MENDCRKMYGFPFSTYYFDMTLSSKNRLLHCNVSDRLQHNGAFLRYMFGSDASRQVKVEQYFRIFKNVEQT